MRSGRDPGLAAIAALVALAAPGCGFGPGAASEGEATLTVTRDYGAEVLREASIEDPRESETVLRALDREADLETAYGGGFVQSVDGVSGTVDAGRSYDWFFYVNGIESSLGSADVDVSPGDRIWWDYRDWTDAMRVPAVVGSFPEPLAQESAQEERLPVRIECAAPRPACDTAAERLAQAGVDASIERHGSAASGRAMRVLVGAWRRLRDDEAAAQVERGPGESGVFARFAPAGAPGRWRLLALDAHARVVRTLSRAGGLIAAVRSGEDPPTWLVTGTDGAGLRAATGLLDEGALEDRYAVATAGGEPLRLPQPQGAAQGG